MACLPEDVLHLVCHELAVRDDFQTLFCCTVSSRILAPLALTHLYRFHGQSAVNDEEAEGLHSSQQELLVQKWSIMWRSIILSARNRTLYPYYRYLRSLELRDLENLLDDSKFRGRIQSIFFATPLMDLQHELDVPVRRQVTEKGASRYTKRLDVQKSVEAIGNLVVPLVPLLEQLSGQFSHLALQSWAPYLQNLQRLELGDGNALLEADGVAHSALQTNCPNLKALMIYQWLNPAADEVLARFLDGMRPNTLESLQTLTDRCGISTRTCLSLNKHRQSLRDLHLCFNVEAVPSMSLLQECTAVESLYLEMPSTIDLELTQNEVFVGLVQWLSKCTSLRQVMLKEFRCAPAMLLPLLQDSRVRLAELEVNASRNVYKADQSQEFHRMLGHQVSLRHLRLKAEVEGDTPVVAEAIIESIRKLVNLKELHLAGISESFGEQETIDILTPLTKLEVVFLGGYEIGDTVLETVARLRDLKSITFSSISNFTINGLLDFVSSLGTGNQGLNVCIDNADPDSLLQDQEVQLVRDALSSKVKGKIDYMPLRDPEISEFEGESD